MKETVVRDWFEVGYFASQYEFHYEYPIGGSGVRKDQICVLDGGERIPLFEFFRTKGIKCAARQLARQVLVGGILRRMERECLERDGHAARVVEIRRDRPGEADARRGDVAAACRMAPTRPGRAEGSSRVMSAESPLEEASPGRCASDLRPGAGGFSIDCVDSAA